MSLLNLKKLAEKVQVVLKDNPQARNSDAVLIKDLYSKFYGISSETPFDQTISGIMNEVIPTFESVTRCRRKIQEQGMYLADRQIARGRKEMQENVKDQILSW